MIALLRNSPSGAIFNPWWQVDQENDSDPRAPQIRRAQLRAYLADRLGNARIALIGEALGYRGGHFTGIPMTSERILLGRSRNARIGTARFFHDLTPRRTSRAEKCQDGFAEPTATIVWSTLSKLGVAPQHFVLWNAFPWHSFDPRRGMLSNRTPTKAEQATGLSVLEAFLDIFQSVEVVALGGIAAGQLQRLNIHPLCVRHPASGGARLFRDQIAKVASEKPKR